MTSRRTFPLLGAAMLLLLVAGAGLFLGALPVSAQSPSPLPLPPVPGANGKVVDLGCLDCHGNPAIEQKGKGLYVAPSALAGSVHANADCVDCHLQLQGVLHADPQKELEAARSSCKGCHEGEWLDWQTSAHGQNVNEGAPTCVTCHGSHDVQPAEGRDFIVEVANDKCSQCHDSRGRSFYRYNYHGKETNLGRYDVAVCADCHTAHQVLPQTDPKSTINDANRVQTCAGCHPGANDNFADIEIHVKADPIPSDPKLAAATVYFIVILTVTFGLFGWHMILSIRHGWRQHRSTTIQENPE